MRVESKDIKVTMVCKPRMESTERRGNICEVIEVTMPMEYGQS